MIILPGPHTNLKRYAVYFTAENGATRLAAELGSGSGAAGRISLDGSRGTSDANPCKALDSRLIPAFSFDSNLHSSFNITKFARKLVLVAAAVALALIQVAAEQEATHLKIHVIHSNHKQVLTVNVTESASGSAAEESYFGADEDEEDDEENEDEEGSSYADRDADVGYGEDGEDDDDDGSGSGKNEAAIIAPVKPGIPVPANATGNAAPAQGSAPRSAACTGKGESPMSVEGVEDIFCVTGQACVADIMGACPGVTTGLPLGAYCGKVKSGVLGCIPNTKTTLKHVAKLKFEAEHLVRELDSQFFLKKKNAEEKKPVVKKVKISHKKH